jgi:hypothetical protein
VKYLTVGVAGGYINFCLPNDTYRGSKNDISAWPQVFVNKEDETGTPVAHLEAVGGT